MEKDHPRHDPSIGTQVLLNNKLKANRNVVRSCSSVKEVVLLWVQQRVNTYPGVNVINFSSSWNDGLAFCALIHYFYPESFNFDALNAKNRKYNFSLAFETAEKEAEICPLLEADDMVKYEDPDWKCVFTYVQSFYRRFRSNQTIQKFKGPDYLQPPPRFKDYFDDEEEEIRYKRYSNRSQSLNIAMKPPEINQTPISTLQIESNKLAARRQSENVEDVINMQKEKLLKLESKRTRNTMSMSEWMNKS